MSLVGFKAQNHEQQVLVRGPRSNVDDRETTADVFGPLHERFGFTIDVAAAEHNAKLPRFYTIDQDGLEQDWTGERVWCNPPYSNIEPWVAKAHVSGAELVVMLLPANRTEQGWWQRQVEPFRDQEGGGLGQVRVPQGTAAVPQAGPEAHRAERAAAVRLLSPHLGRREVNLVPISIAEANRYVLHHHRHMRPKRGALFALGVEKDGVLVGVAVVGRPPRELQDGRTVDIQRVATDGTKNACSFLMSRARRAARALGYTKVITYTRQDESGSSPAGAGFVQEALLPARSHAKANVARLRFDQSKPAPRIRWAAPA